MLLLLSRMVENAAFNAPVTTGRKDPANQKRTELQRFVVHHTEFRVDLGFMSWGGGLAEKRGM